VQLVGSVDTELLQKSGRTCGYSKDDYHTLLRTVNWFGKRWITQSIATESCNLLDNLNKGNGYGIFARMRAMMEHFEELNSGCIPISRTQGFEKFGFADASVAMLASKGIVALTDDFPLYNRLQTMGLACVNFNHIRGWDLSGN